MYTLQFTQRPSSLNDVIAIMEELGGIYMPWGRRESGERFIFSRRFSITYWHDAPLVGTVAKAVLELEHGYDEDRLFKQLSRLFKRMPGFAFNERVNEEVRLVHGRIDVRTWGGSVPAFKTMIDGHFYHVYGVDDTGLASLWRRPVEVGHPEAIGRVPYDITREELAMALVAEAIYKEVP